MKLLKKWGADCDDAIERMMGDEAFYYSVLLKFYKSGEWKELKEKIDKKVYTEAFRTAHDIKGVTSTLGLNPLVTSVSAVVEDLRTEPKTEEQMNRLDCDMELFLKKIEEFCIMIE